MLQRIDNGLWEISRPLNAPGLKIDHKMTVIKLGSGGLMLHSPVAFDAELGSSLAALGPVECLVAPSTYHDLYWPEWFRNYPAAQFFCAPGVRDEHPDLPFHHELHHSSEWPWAGDVEFRLLEGIPKLNEIAFLHRSTRTLVVADLVFNLSVQQGLLGRLFLRLNGVYGRVGCSRIFRRFIKDRVTFRESLEKILQWDFDRIVMGHGTTVETGGKDALRRAYNWLPCENEAP